MEVGYGALLDTRDCQRGRRRPDEAETDDWECLVRTVSVFGGVRDQAVEADERAVRRVMCTCTGMAIDMGLPVALDTRERSGGLK